MRNAGAQKFAVPIRLDKLSKTIHYSLQINPSWCLSKNSIDPLGDGIELSESSNQCGVSPKTTDFDPTAELRTFSFLDGFLALFLWSRWTPEIA